MATVLFRTEKQILLRTMHFIVMSECIKKCNSLHSLHYSMRTLIFTHTHTHITHPPTPLHSPCEKRDVFHPFIVCRGRCKQCLPLPQATGQRRENVQCGPARCQTKLREKYIYLKRFPQKKYANARNDMCARTLWSCGLVDVALEIDCELPIIVPIWSIDWVCAFASFSPDKTNSRFLKVMLLWRSLLRQPWKW